MQNVIEYKIPRRDGEKHCHIDIQREIENLSNTDQLKCHSCGYDFICLYPLFSVYHLFHMWLYSGIQTHLYTALNVSTLEECKKEVSMEYYLFDQFYVCLSRL